MALGPQKVLIRRTETANFPPTGLMPGELSVEMNEPLRLWVGVPTNLDASGKKLLVPQPSVVTSDGPPPNPSPNLLWWETDSGILWLWYNDGGSTQWVQVSNSGAKAEEVVTDADEVRFEPGGSLSADDVQEALIELDLEKVAKAGDTMTGFLTLNADPTNPLHAVTKQYVDAADLILQNAINGKLGDAPNDGKIYGRKNLAWAVVTASGIAYVPAGDIAAVDVQGAITELDTEKVDIDGDTMTGPLYLPAANPTGPTQAAHKGYVDEQIANVVGMLYSSIPIVFSFSGKPGNNARINVPIAIEASIPANLTGSLAFASIATTADAVFTVNKVSGGSTTAIGTVTVKASGTHTFAGAGGTFAVGDVLQVIAPATQDATLADIGITILTERSL